MGTSNDQKMLVTPRVVGSSCLGRIIFVHASTLNFYFPFFVFDEQAGVLDDNEAGGVSFCSSGFVNDSLLEPQGFGVDGDGRIGDGSNLFGATEDVDDVDGEWNVFEVGVGFFAEDFGLVGVDRDNFVANR